MLYSVADVCQLVGVTRQSVVQRLKEHKIVSSMDKIGNKYALPQTQLERLLFLSYPKAYYVFTGKEGSSIDIITTSIGKIQNVSSGKRSYYYIRNFTLKMSEQKLIYFQSKGYSTKQEAENVRINRIELSRAILSQEEIEQFSNLYHVDKEYLDYKNV